MYPSAPPLHRFSLPSRKHVFAPLGAVAFLLLTGAGASAQVASAREAQDATAPSPGTHPAGSPVGSVSVAELGPAPLTETAGLPEAPGAVTESSNSLVAISEFAAAGHAIADNSKSGLQASRPASPTDITVLPGQSAPRQTVRDKFVGSVRDSVSPFSLGGELISAGYSHVTNGSPNYGTNATAFAQRFGASVARGTSQNLFYEGAMAAILREDPRYYQMGHGQPFFKRLVYAGTRPLITRTDGGKSTPNIALLSGYLGAAALTKVYYPQINQGFDQTLITYGGSIGGAALGYVVSEFLSGALQVIHLKKGD